MIGWQIPRILQYLTGMALRKLKPDVESCGLLPFAVPSSCSATVCQTRLPPFTAIVVESACPLDKPLKVKSINPPSRHDFGTSSKCFCNPRKPSAYHYSYCRAPLPRTGASFPKRCVPGKRASRRSSVGDTGAEFGRGFWACQG